MNLAFLSPVTSEWDPDILELSNWSLTWSRHSPLLAENYGLKLGGTSSHSRHFKLLHCKLEVTTTSSAKSKEEILSPPKWGPSTNVAKLRHSVQKLWTDDGDSKVQHPPSPRDRKEITTGICLRILVCNTYIRYSVSLIKMDSFDISGNFIVMITFCCYLRLFCVPIHVRYVQ